MTSRPAPPRAHARAHPAGPPPFPFPRARSPPPSSFRALPTPPAQNRHAAAVPRHPRHRDHLRRHLRPAPPGSGRVALAGVPCVVVQRAGLQADLRRAALERQPQPAARRRARARHGRGLRADGQAVRARDGRTLGHCARAAHRRRAEGRGAGAALPHLHRPARRVLQVLRDGARAGRPQDHVLVPAHLHRAARQRAGGVPGAGQPGHAAAVGRPYPGGGHAGGHRRGRGRHCAPARAAVDVLGGGGDAVSGAHCRRAQRHPLCAQRAGQGHGRGVCAAGERGRGGAGAGAPQADAGAPLH
ncbi:hypothetical protein FGB62_37g136 [Gracilaria domingensis]|nr:hypothetical protein FGB62_37g136 [Gracilaria domingensis]